MAYKCTDKRPTVKATCPYCGYTRESRLDSAGRGRSRPVICGSKYLLICRSCAKCGEQVRPYLKLLYEKHRESADNLGVAVRSVISYLLIHWGEMKRFESDFNLLDYPVIPSHCPDLGLKLRMGRGNGAINGDSFSKERHNVISLDHIENSKPAKGNVRWVSHRANVLKRDASLDEIGKLVESWALLIKGAEYGLSGC